MDVRRVNGGELEIPEGWLDVGTVNALVQSRRPSTIVEFHGVLESHVQVVGDGEVLGTKG